MYSGWQSLQSPTHRDEAEMDYVAKLGRLAKQGYGWWSLGV
jgi:hypothetical protein